MINISIASATYCYGCRNIREIFKKVLGPFLNHWLQCISYISIRIFDLSKILGLPLKICLILEFIAFLTLI